MSESGESFILLKLCCAQSVCLQYTGISVLLPALAYVSLESHQRALSRMCINASSTCVLYVAFDQLIDCASYCDTIDLAP